MSEEGDLLRNVTFDCPLCDEAENCCGCCAWLDVLQDQGPTAADSGALISDRRQGAARTVSPVVDHHPERSVPAPRRTAPPDPHTAGQRRTTQEEK